MSCLHFHTTITSSTSFYLLEDTTFKKQSEWFKFNHFAFSLSLQGLCASFIVLSYYRSSVSTSLYTLMILRGTYSQRLFRVLKLITHFPNVTILPSESSFMCWEKHYVKYAETRILVYMQFLKIVCTKQKCSGSFSRLLKAKHPTPSHKSSSGVTPPSSYRSSTFVRQH